MDPIHRVTQKAPMEIAFAGDYETLAARIRFTCMRAHPVREPAAVVWDDQSPAASDLAWAGGHGA